MVYVICQFIHCCIICGRHLTNSYVLKRILTSVSAAVHKVQRSFCCQTFAPCSVSTVVNHISVDVYYLLPNLLYTQYSTVHFFCFVFSYVWLQCDEDISLLNGIQSSASVEIVLLSSVMSREWGCFHDISPLAPASSIHSWCPCYFHTDGSFYISNVHYYQGPEHME